LGTQQAFDILLDIDKYWYEDLKYGTGGKRDTGCSVLRFVAGKTVKDKRNVRPSNTNLLGC
jgi:hypothetical protein